MSRRQIAIGISVAFLGGFAISRVGALLDLGAGLTAVAFSVLIVGLLLIQLGPQPTEPAGKER